MDEKYKGKYIIVPLTMPGKDVESLKDKVELDQLVNGYVRAARESLVECILEARPDLR